MSLMRMPFTLAGQWVTGVTIVGFIIATTGCDGVSVTLPGGDGSGGGNDLYGVIVNTDPSKDLIGGVRMKSGEAVWTFGTLNSDGSVAEVTSTVYENAAGQKATLFYESGRPSRAVGFDGSELELTYSEVTTQRLKGRATYTPAGGGTSSSIDFDIDLQLTAAQLAQTVQDLTGIRISTEEPPAESAAGENTTTKVKTMAGEIEVKSSGIIIIPIILAITGFSITLVCSQILKGFVAVGNTVMLAFLTPFILMGNLMRLALGQPLVTVDYDPLNPVINIPRP